MAGLSNVINMNAPSGSGYPFPKQTQVNILKTLLDSMASPALQNENGPHWTPLHAAALQEEGKACMLLLDRHADPLAKDKEGT